MIDKYDCKHCKSTGFCGTESTPSCHTCAEKSGFETAWWRSNPKVVCSVCLGKGYHTEASQLGPRMPKPQGLRMPGLTPMPKFPGLTKMPKLSRGY